MNINTIYRALFRFSLADLRDSSFSGSIVQHVDCCLRALQTNLCGAIVLVNAFVNMALLTQMRSCRGGGWLGRPTGLWIWAINSGNGFFEVDCNKRRGLRGCALSRVIPSFVATQPALFGRSATLHWSRDGCITSLFYVSIARPSIYWLLFWRLLWPVYCPAILSVKRSRLKPDQRRFLSSQLHFNEQLSDTSRAVWFSSPLRSNLCH